MSQILKNLEKYHDDVYNDVEMSLGYVVENIDDYADYLRLLTTVVECVLSTSPSLIKTFNEHVEQIDAILNDFQIKSNWSGDYYKASEIMFKSNLESIRNLYDDVEMIYLNLFKQSGLNYDCESIRSFVTTAWGRDFDKLKTAFEEFRLK